MPKAYKKRPNWKAIEALYLQGVTPSEIESVYDVTSKQVRDKAYKNGWGKTKATISDKIATAVEEDLSALSKLTIKVHTQFMLKLQDQMKEITNPYLLDGERVNSLFQTAMNNSVKLTLNALKEQEQETGEGDAVPIEITFKRPES
jgi:hypothetical protein